MPEKLLRAFHRQAAVRPGPDLPKVLEGVRQQDYDEEPAETVQPSFKQLGFERLRSSQLAGGHQPDPEGQPADPQLEVERRGGYFNMFHPHHRRLLPGHGGAIGGKIEGEGGRPPEGQDQHVG